jgi:hypothetical protein
VQGQIEGDVILNRQPLSISALFRGAAAVPGISPPQGWFLREFQGALVFSHFPTQPDAAAARKRLKSLTTLPHRLE